MNRTLRTLTVVLSTVALSAGSLLASGAGAQAAPLTPWNNPYNDYVKVAGAPYTVHFIGSGKHVYKSVNFGGCALRLAKQYSITVYKDSNPSRVIYRKTMDGLHMLYATAGDTYESNGQKFKSEGALLKLLKSRVNASPKVAAWGTGGKELAEARMHALGNDIEEVWDTLNTYAVNKARKIAAAQPVDPEKGKPVAADYIDSISFDNFDVAAHMKSTKRLYGTGCRSEGGQAQFERKVTVSGTFASSTIIETDVTDNVTIGRVSPSPAGQHYFRLVNGKRVYFASALKAAAAFK